MAKTALMKNTHSIPTLFYFANGCFNSTVISGKMIIGRATVNNSVEIDLSAGFVSRRHAEIDCDLNGVYYVDTESTNGTFYNGVKIQKNCRQYLCDGDVLQIFRDSVKSDKDFICLIFSTDCQNNFEVKCVEINDSVAEINIGRTVNTDISLRDNTVSENHASFFSTQYGWAVIDHNSKNGVFLNNQRIYNAEYLKIGDCIRIANNYFIYTGSTFLYIKNNQRVDKRKAYKDVPLDIRIAQKSVWQRMKKLMLLQNINMTVHSGEMILILGGSGAGKTTFMNAVMGYEKADGKIMHGNTDIYEDFQSMKYKIGFVPQQDLLRGNDTVYDTLKNAAEMKIPSKYKREERIKIIESVLDNFGLQRERDFLVSKLSGGQRKRLSIAVEYIGNPSLFFLDEPDSGLDGIMAKSLMQKLRNIADEGKIIMGISHSPDRCKELFDKVAVLAKGSKDNCGHLAFFGAVKEAVAFFDTDSLEGIIKKINRKDEGGDGMSDFYIQKYSDSL